MKSFLLMLSFFTRIPVKAAFDEDGTIYEKGIKYIFIIALIIGVPVGFVLMLSQWIGSWTAAFLAFLVYLMMTGGLHVDGLADTMDAFGSNRDRPKMLAILKDSRIGTFGVLGIVVYAIGMVVLLAQADIAAAFLFPLAGRTAALLIARIFRYAREDGMGRRFVDGVKTVHVIIAMAVYVAAVGLVCTAFLTAPFDTAYAAVLCVPYVLALAAVTLTAAGMSRKLGGITGDNIGFGIEACSLIYLLIFYMTAAVLG